MQANLNDSYITRLPFASKGTRYEVRDKRLPGFTLRVGSKRKSFYWHTRVNTKPVKIHLGEFGHTTVHQARLEVLKLILQSREGVLPPSLRKEKALRCPSPTLQEVLDQYLVMRKLRPTSVESYKKIARLYLDDFMPREVTSITSQECMKLYQGLRDDKSPAKANDAIRLLNALLLYAAAVYDVEVCQVKAKIKAAGILAATPARDSMIKDKQLTSWFDSLKPRPLHYRVMLLTTVLTGFRKAEIEKLLWSDFSWEEDKLLARDTKNHRDHLLPIGQNLVEILMRYQTQSQSEKIFGERVDRWASIASQKGGIKFSMHSLRRTFTTVATKVLGNPLLVKALVNHSVGNDVTAKNYVRFEQEDLKQAMAKVEAVILDGLHLKEFLPELFSDGSKGDDSA